MGIDHLLSREEAALFAGMGLGKTAMVFAALSKLIADGACRGALVVAPLRVSLFTWPDEGEKWENFRWMRVVSLRTQEGLDAWQRGDACIYTINYESLFIPRRDRKTGETKDYGMLSKLIKGQRASHLPVDTVIWDELSKCKDTKSKRVREFRKYRGKFKRHWGLTGTPTPNSMLDLFGQMLLLDDGKTFGRVKGNFQKQYFQPDNIYSPHPKWELRDGCRGMIEQKLKDVALTLRSEDYLDIPPVTTEDVKVALPAKVANTYKKLQKEMVLRIKDDLVTAASQGVLVGKLQQVLGGAVYAQTIESVFEPGADEKVVTHVHDAKIKALRALWESEGRKPMLVAIKFKHERERILQAFPEAQEFSSEKLADWNAGKIPMLVAHPLSMSHGLNMQAGGSRICWFTMTYSREEYDQMNARLARTGQGAETKIFRLLVPGTVDDAVTAANEAKGSAQSAFLQTLKNLQRLEQVV